jgi:hypothetical protein
MPRYFKGIRNRDDAIVLLREAGYELHDHQRGGDFEHFVRTDDAESILLIDFALGRFIVDFGNGNVLSDSSNADEDPEYSKILASIYRS